MRDDDRHDSASLWREALRAITLGWDLAVPIFAGVLIGHFLDRLLASAPIFTLGLLTLGIMISYYNLARLIRRMQSHDRRKKRERQDKEGSTEEQ